MDKFIYDKTDKGREEIATRKHGLAPRMRSLLVLVDGKKDKTELLKKVAGLGLTEQSIDELVENNFIESHVSAPVAPPVVAMVTPPSAVSDAKMSEAENTASPAISTTDFKEDSNKKIGLEQVTALHQFFNETIKSTIGLRGFTLQMKAEQAYTLEEFRELRQAYLEAVLKAKGRDVTIGLRDRLDQLLDNAEKSMH